MSSVSATLSADACREPKSGAAPTFIVRAIETLELWGERWHQRRALRELPDYLQHDVALSSADIEAEASKPFWRA